MKETAASKRPLGSAAFWIAAAGIALGLGAWRYLSTSPFGWHVDEGSFVVSAYWLSKGQRLYSQVPILQYPVLLELLGLLYRVAPVTLQTARLAVIFFGMTYVVATGLAGRYLAGWAGGVTAMAVLLFDRELFDGAGQALSEIPALAFLSVSVLLLLMYLTHGQRAYLWTGSLMCGLSLLVKPFAFLLPLWVGWVVCARHIWRDEPPREGPAAAGWRGMAVDLAAAAAWFAVPFVACLLLYDARAFVDYTLLSRISSRAMQDWSLAGNAAIIAEYIRGSRGAWLLALAGLFVLDTTERAALRQAVGLWSLLGAALAGLLWYAPLYVRHCVVLSLPVALLAGMAAGTLVRPRDGEAHRVRRWAALGLAAAALVLVVADTPDLVAWRGSFRQYTQGGAEADAMRLLERISRPGERIVTDDLGMAFVMDRRVPPTLSDVSHARIRAGLLTDADVMGTVIGEDVQTVSVWTERFRRLKEFAAWADAHFAGHVDFGQDRRILHGRRYTSPDEIPGLRPLPGVALGEDVELIGYRLEPETLRPGEPARLTLYWQATGPVPRDYQVLVHLARPGEAPVAQADSGPLNGLYPTARWRPGEILADVHWLTAPPGTPPGEYELLAGMYDPGSLRRLPARQPGQAGPRDTVRLAAVPIAAQ